MALPLKGSNRNGNVIEQSLIPDGATVIFDWDNTLKVINVKKRCIESRVKAEFLECLVRDKQCTLFIISAIQPSRINMSTILMEVDKLGLRKYFCYLCQHELSSCENPTHSRGPAHQNESLEIPSCQSRINSFPTLKNKTQDDPPSCYSEPSECYSESKQEVSKNCVPWECSHKLDIELVNGEYRYARWGNIVISGYDKAEVFLELCHFCYPFPELPQVIDWSAIRCSTSQQNESFQFECDYSVPTDGTEEPDCYDEAKDSSLMKLERPVIFFDDEIVNIDNFKAIVKDSQCYLVA